MSWRRLFGLKDQEQPAAQPAPLELIEEGNRLEESGQLELAMQRYDAALHLAPAWPKAHLNKGNLLHRAGQVDAALATYRQVLQIDPSHAGAHFNIGNVLAGEGRFEESLAAYHEAVLRDPDFVDAHVAIGYVLDETRCFDAAVESYQRALALRPDYAEVHSNLGNALRNAGRFHDALRCHDRAAELNPSRVETHMNRGNLLRDLGRLDAAEAAYRRALELQPDQLDALSSLLFLHNYRADRLPQQLLGEARLFGDLVVRRARPYAHWNTVMDPERPLRIGLVSGDLRQHPVGHFLEGVLSAWARGVGERMSLHAYPSFHCNDAQSQRMRACCASWTPIFGRADEEVAGKILDDAIDILIDLSGHTAHNRLPMFAWKPSPLAVTWLGYFATTGVAAIDHVLADPWTLPEDQAGCFTENVWRLPQTRLCFTPPDMALEVNPLPATGGAPLTFGCFNNLTKVTDTVLALWTRVLNAVPNSRLFLKAAQLSDAAERQRIVHRLASLGIAPTRLVLEGLSGRADYLAAYGRVDIGLDPFPFPGGTTTVEALWMGVPILSLTGESFLSRQGVGLLTNAGLPDWVARDEDDYVRLAGLHAGDTARLAELRARLRRQVLDSPVFDAPRFVVHLETALREMWRARCRQGAG